MRELARPHLRALADVTGETATLSVPGDPDAVTVDFAQSAASVQSVARLGRPSVAHATAAGKVVLAFGEVALPLGELRRFTAATITDQGMLAKEIDGVRRRGFAQALGEREDDLNAVAVPLLGARGDLVAVVGVQGPASRFTEEAIGRVLEALREHAARPAPVRSAALSPLRPARSQDSPRMAAVEAHMSRDLVTVGRDESLVAAAARMAERRVGAALVLDGERLVGILTERDVLNAVAAGGVESAVVSSRMTHRAGDDRAGRHDRACGGADDPRRLPAPARRRRRATGRAVRSIRDLVRIALDDSAPRRVGPPPAPTTARAGRCRRPTSTEPARRAGPTRSCRTRAASAVAITTLVSRTAATGAAGARASAASTNT